MLGSRSLGSISLGSSLFSRKTISKLVKKAKALLTSLSDVNILATATRNVVVPGKAKQVGILASKRAEIKLTGKDSRSNPLETRQTAVGLHSKGKNTVVRTKTVKKATLGNRSNKTVIAKGKNEALRLRNNENRETKI